MPKDGYWLLNQGGPEVTVGNKNGYREKIFTTEVVTTTDTTIKLSNQDIVKAIQSHIHIPNNAACTVKVHVPGGGDWSHMDLAIDSETPIIIQYRTTKKNKQ